VLFLAVLPFLEQKEIVPVSSQVPSTQTVQPEAELKKIEATTTVMVLKTQQKQWTVLWVVPALGKQEGIGNAL
jgi:hypothetical protein